jgi:2'-5' RNA ligase
LSSPGTSSGRTQSAILVPVPEAEDLVGRFRLDHDPVAAAGVPAHITLVVPWLPPAEIDSDSLDELDGQLAEVSSFPFRLTSVGWFARKVLWLAPEPAEPFVRLTWSLAEHFSTPPWDDEFDEVVPHLTIGHASDGVELAPVAKALVRRLPLDCVAKEVWVMVGDGTRWQVRHQVPLR